MRMRALAGGIAMVALAVSVGYAAEASAQDQTFFEKHANDIVKVKAEPLDNPALAKVLQGKFFNLKLTVGGGVETEVAARVGDKVVMVTMPGTDAAMPSFQELIKPDFKLSTDAEAHALQDALDILYPVSSDDAKVKTIRHTGNTWTFIRGKFFEHFDGVIVTTDDKGAVTSVKRSLEVK